MSGTGPLDTLAAALNALDTAGIEFDLAHGCVTLTTPQGGHAGDILRGPANRWVLRLRAPAEKPA